jgi:PhnB protein
MFIPTGFGSVTPYFFVKDAESFVEFLVQGLAGFQILRHLRPDGRIANAQVKLGTSVVMVSEASIEYPPMPASYYFYVTNVVEAMNKALSHGATLEMEVMDMPYGDRQGGIRDTHGNIWWLSERTVDEPYKA